jgi:methionyl aminopeptidase
MTKGGIRLKSDEEIKVLREGGKILKETLELLRKKVAPGVSTGELNEIAENHLASLGVEGAFKGYHGFPAALCTSVNDRTVHGIPRFDEVLRDGDIIGMDFGVIYKGLITDSCVTVGVGKVGKDVQKLMDVTEKALDLGLRQAMPGRTVRDVSRAVQDYVEGFGYGIVRELIGHGVGYEVHEAPEVPNFVSAGAAQALVPGLVIAIEPIVTMGDYKVETLADRWTIRTKDGSLSAHFEHSVAILEDGQLILTD